MVLNLNDYRIQVKEIKTFLDAKTEGWNYKEVVGVLAIYCNTHIVAVSHYIGEIYGFTDEIKAKIKSDSDFYQITEVIGHATQPTAEK